jgi:tetratricopeptide (TPR) repeat protein|tara:strand:+ start:1996 stop:2676 length:681 start_codon:yes stop_codon:yes gene_type:complete
MKIRALALLPFLILTSCISQKNSKEFITATSGRYLFNANEVLEIYFDEDIMLAKWRGNDAIELLKVNDSSFYMKALNERMLFVGNPKMHIELAVKTKHDGILYHFKKMEEGTKTPNEYFKEKEYDKALAGFLSIQKADSLNRNIRERSINSWGYEYRRKQEFDAAIEVFKINIALYPRSSNVYDSMGDTYLSKKDTINAVIYYKKALTINPENRNANKAYQRLTAE